MKFSLELKLLPSIVQMSHKSSFFNPPNLTLFNREKEIILSHLGRPSHSHLTNLNSGASQIPGLEAAGYICDADGKPYEIQV